MLNGLWKILAVKEKSTHDNCELLNRREYITWKVFDIYQVVYGALTRPGFLIRFVLANPHVAAALVGTQNVQHLRSNIAAAEKGPLSPDVFEEAKRRLDAIGRKTGVQA